ncbi:MAG: hypothetical protein QGG36_21435 [Pirellulaceae bacterium]|nr:hypothetical protein [Pirellulaceae bacterium]
MDAPFAESSADRARFRWQLLVGGLIAVCMLGGGALMQRRKLARQAVAVERIVAAGGQVETSPNYSPSPLAPVLGVDPTYEAESVVITGSDAPAMFRELRYLHGVTNLTLNRSVATAAEMRELQFLRSLKKLSIEDVETPDGLALPVLPSLTHLAIKNTPLSGEDAIAIARQTTLTELILIETHLPADAIEMLQSDLPRCAIEVK